MDSNINQLFNQTIDKMKSMVDVSWQINEF